MLQSLNQLPTLGEPWPDHLPYPWAGPRGRYFGVLANAQGQLYVALLLDEQPGPLLTWSKAMAYADKLQASLMTRPEGALFFNVAKDQFAPEAHWTCEVIGDRSAWSQYFSHGYQTSDDKSAELRARVVRRLLLESFDPFREFMSRATQNTAGLRSAAEDMLAACSTAEAAMLRLAEPA